jgi:hypothetical protein
MTQKRKFLPTEEEKYKIRLSPAVLMKGETGKLISSKILKINRDYEIVLVRDRGEFNGVPRKLLTKILLHCLFKWCKLILHAVCLHAYRWGQLDFLP